MTQRLRRAAHAGDAAAISALLRLSIRQNDAASLAEALAAWHLVDVVAVAEWLVGDEGRAMWPFRARLIAALEQSAPKLTADIRDLFGEEAPFVLIKPGEFIMGSPSDEPMRDFDESLHKVEITRHFLMGKTPVTQARWVGLMGENPSHFKGPRRPVERVSWFDAVMYCNRVSRDPRARLFYRLPTEAEWEYVCRAGNSVYAGIDSLESVAWFHGNSQGRTHSVAKKSPNAWGLFDMLGGVGEWVADRYSFYLEWKQVDPFPESNSLSRIYRGGSWENGAEHIRAAARSSAIPSTRRDYLGFRCARSLE